MATTIDYNNRFFRSIGNADNGEVDGNTIFHYSQAESRLWATYQGGKIRYGVLVGNVHVDGALDFHYHHINEQGASMDGICHSEPELLPDGRIRLREKWQWLSGDQSHGESYIEEISYPVGISYSSPARLPAQFDRGQTAYYISTNGDYVISTDPARLDPQAIHAYLSQSYWAPGRPLPVVAHTLRHSLCFGLYHENTQVGLARVITDYAIFAYLCDVYVLEAHRGHGLGKWLLTTVLEYPSLRHVLRWTLSTRDAHDLYRHFGFESLRSPESQMELRRPVSWV